MDSHRHDPEREAEMLDDALAALRKAQYRITRPRRAILQALIQRKGPVSIEELHSELEEGLCDLATVYRCLAAFERLGLVRRCYLTDGTGLFEINLGQEHHHHIVCTSCRKVELLDFCVVEGLERLVRDRGYSNVSHMLEFFGVCADCSEQEEESSHARGGGRR